jgi:hypothetical protein
MQCYVACGAARHPAAPCALLSAPLFASLAPLFPAAAGRAGGVSLALSSDCSPVLFLGCLLLPFFTFFPGLLLDLGHTEWARGRAANQATHLGSTGGNAGLGFRSRFRSQIRSPAEHGSDRRSRHAPHCFLVRGRRCSFSSTGGARAASTQALGSTRKRSSHAASERRMHSARSGRSVRFRRKLVVTRKRIWDVPAGRSEGQGARRCAQRW